MQQDLGTIMAPPEAEFAIFVSGDCLVDSGVFDGDIVFLVKKEAREEDIVLVRFDNQVTLKHYFPKKDHAILKPANPKYKPIVVRDFEILGVFVGLYRPA